MKEKFIEWLNENLKQNSSLLTQLQYDEIVSYLKAEDKTGFARKLKRRVDNKYELLSFPVFGVEDILCVSKKNQASILLFCYVI